MKNPRGMTIQVGSKGGKILQGGGQMFPFASLPPSPNEALYKLDVHVSLGERDFVVRSIKTTFTLK